MTVEVLHLCFTSPHLPGSYNRPLGQFLRSSSAVGHSVLSCGPAAGVDQDFAGRVRFTSGAASSRMRLALNRVVARREADRYSCHRDGRRAAYASEAEHFIKHSRPAVVVVYDDVRLALRLGGKKRRYALAFSQHGTSYNLTDQVEAALYNSDTLDGITVLSHAARELIEALPSARDLRVDVCPNAVDTDRYVPTDRAGRSVARGMFGLSSSPVVTFVGRVTPQKGVHHAIEAVSAVRRVIPDVQLLIAGTGPQEYLDQLRRQIDSLALADHVSFAGPVDPDQVPHLYQASDLMLFPTLVPEGMPLVVLESMSAGCPVVGYSFASGRDIASAAEGLITVPGGEVGELVAAVRHLLADHSTRAELAIAAREAMLNRFSFEPWCSRQATLLRGYSSQRSRDHRPV